ncbi:TPA: hypothetical protein ACJ509_004006 [Stenotrophomonas maltophilia]
MNSTMADGASERLDAQIADALFGQPGMSKMDVANRLRQLRGDGGALLGSAAYPAAWMWPHPEDGSVRFTVDGDVATEAASMGRAVSALYRVPVQEDGQPSPAGQVDALPPLPKARVIGAGRHAPIKLHYGYTAEQMQNYAQAALAARQPVGEEPIGRVFSAHGILGIEWRDGMVPPAGATLYAAPPAQAGDLGPVREALQAAARSLRTIADSTKDTEFLETASEIRAYAGSRASCAEQALIDSKAVGNG